MPEEVTLPETSDTDHKSRIRQRLRGKLSRWDSKASRENESRDQDILSFLHVPNSGRATSIIPEPNNPPGLGFLASGRLPYNAASSQVKPKRPRQPNLAVKFTAEAPTIIGEGGDEAVVPVAELLSSVVISPELSTTSLERADFQDLGTATHVSDPRSQGLEDDLFRPRALQRRPTGLQDYDLDEFPEQESIVKDRNHGPSDPLASFRSSSNDKTLREDPQLVRSVLAEGKNSANKFLPGRRKNQGPGSNTLYLPLQDPATSFANSLTPLPSPQPPQNSASSPNLNPSFVPTGEDHDGDPTSRSPRSSQQETQQLHRNIPPKPIVEARRWSLRDVAEGLGDDAYLDFATRIQSFRNVFLLGLGARTEPTLQQWVTAATWWFLKGRSEVESSVRAGPQGSAGDTTSTGYIPHSFRQAYVDLAKSWWIVAEMTPTRYPAVKRLESRDPADMSDIMQSYVDMKTMELIQIHSSVISNLRSLIMSMKRNGRLPPFGLELQGLDTRVFIAYPTLSPSAARLLSVETVEAVDSNEHGGMTSFFPMPIKDTQRYFNYGRMFVDVILDNGKTTTQIALPCLLSVLRDKRDREITLAIANQDDQIRLVIQPAEGSALSWRDAHWETNHRCIRLDLGTDFQVRIQLIDNDFRTVWGIHDYIRTVQKQSQGTKNETLIFEQVLRSFQYFDPGKAVPPFPKESMADCRLRLFEYFKVIVEAPGERKVHDGYRLMVVTARKVKTLRSVSHDVGRRAPIIFSYLRDEQGAPAMLLKMSKSSRDPSMVMSFEQQGDRERLYALLNGTKSSRDEESSDILGLKSYSISVGQGHEIASINQAGLASSLDWKRLQVFRQHIDLAGPAIRICVECDMGSFVDRVNRGPGELQMRLEIDYMNRITIPRNAQSDMTVCFADRNLSKELCESLREMLDQITKSPSIRTFEFHSLHELHTFQALTTGCSVLFDGFARTFSISRRRMVVPIHKRWEASMTRLQVVKYEKTIQLIAFFKDFSHGSCMSFALKSTDVFESFSRSGTPYICIVDAKFSLPREEDSRNHGYVCLGMPEYPGEHDDISIGFESEEDRDSFSNVLPATVSQQSRLNSLRR